LDTDSYIVHSRPNVKKTHNKLRHSVLRCDQTKTNMEQNISKEIRDVIQSITDKSASGNIPREEVEVIILGLLKNVVLDFQYHRLETDDSLVRLDLIADKYMNTISDQT
jgi:hypothetical protein